jgi:hypothetical protein
MSQLSSMLLFVNFNGFPMWKSRAPIEYNNYMLISKFAHEVLWAFSAGKKLLNEYVIYA